MSNSNNSGDKNQSEPRVGSLLNEFHLIDDTDEDSDLFKKKSAPAKKKASLFDAEDDDEEDLLGFRTKDDDEKKYLTMTFGEDLLQKLEKQFTAYQSNRESRRQSRAFKDTEHDEDPEVTMSDLNARLTNLQTNADTTGENNNEAQDENVEVDENFARRGSLRVRRKATNMSSKGYWNLVQQNMGEEDNSNNQRRATISSGPTEHTHDESVKNRVDFWKTKVEEGGKKEPPQPPPRSPRSNQTSAEFQSTTLVARTSGDTTTVTEQQTTVTSTENSTQVTQTTTEVTTSDSGEFKEKPSARSSWRNSRPTAGTFKAVSLESVSTDPLSAKDPPKMSPRFLDRKGSVPVMVEQRALHQSMPVPKSTNMAAEDAKPAAPQAHAKTPSILPKNSKQVRDYDYYLNMAKSMDFTEFQQYRMLYQAGVDFSNRPIIVLIGSRVPAKKISLDMFILYTLSTMDPIVEKEYSIVYVHSGMTSENKLSFSWLRKVSSMFTRKYKKNLKQLFIIQPTFFVKTVFGLFRPFISSKFWKKLVYIDDIKQQLSKYMNIQQLMLPDDVLQSTLKRSGAKADEHQIFGVKLEEVMLHPLNKDKKVPFIVEKALLYVEQHGLQTEGIFRLSGNSNKIQEMKKLIDKGQDVKFSDEFEAHAIAGLLKLYFRELPDPLFTFALYNDIVACHAEGDDDKCLELLRGVLAKLPEVNRYVECGVAMMQFMIPRHCLTRALMLARLTLKRLMYTLEIIAGSAVTKMTPVNLSIVFAPNLLRCLNETPEIALRDTPAVNRLMKLMIINHSVLLP